MSIIKKMNLAIDFLKEHEPPEGYFLAYSGGKDSTVLLDLARKAKVKFDAHFNVTTVDPPELLEFVKSEKGIIWEYPKTNMWDLIIKNGIPPTRIIKYCCRELKVAQGAGRHVLTGVRAAESSTRQKRQQVEEAIKPPNRWLYHPIFYWEDIDIWEYIRYFQLPYCSLYDEGFTRIGCVGCPQAGINQRRKEAERWPEFKAYYIKTFDKMIEVKKAKGLHRPGWETGEDVWDWWLTPKKTKTKKKINK